jgi:hypothetical protein
MFLQRILLPAIAGSIALTEAHVAQAGGLPVKSFGVVLPEDVQWAPFSAFPPEARLAVLVGDPQKSGPYVVRVKVPGGVKLMPHTHLEDRVYTVISGIFYIVNGGAMLQFQRRSISVDVDNGLCEGSRRLLR